MELRHLRYFVAVAERKSFTRAAAQLHLAQPSLTRQVKNLEEELGVILLNRIKGQISLTDDGRSFLENAKHILAISAESVQAIQQSAPVQQLNIGYRSDLPYHLLPATLSTFGQLHPRIALNLFDMTSSEQLAALEARDIDLGFIGLQHAVDHVTLTREPIATYDVLVALPESSPLSKKPAIHLKQLEKLFFVGLSEKALPGWRNSIQQMSLAAGFALRILQEADAEHAALKFVAAGLGVALLPEQVKLAPHSGVVLRPLRPSKQFDACMAWRTDNKSEYLGQYINVVRRASTNTAKTLSRQA
jgi:DNA-binding transcriptional LysR family regulator